MKCPSSRRMSMMMNPEPSDDATGLPLTRNGKSQLKRDIFQTFFGFGLIFFFLMILTFYSTLFSSAFQFPLDLWRPFVFFGLFFCFFLPACSLFTLFLFVGFVRLCIHSIILFLIFVLNYVACSFRSECSCVLLVLMFFIEYVNSILLVLVLLFCFSS